MNYLAYFRNAINHLKDLGADGRTLKLILTAYRMLYWLDSSGSRQGPTEGSSEGFDHLGLVKGAQFRHWLSDY
jgi:hypothetical protein